MTEFGIKVKKQDNAIKMLEQIRGETSTPLMTYALFCEEVGYSIAPEVIAALVNRIAWDGRIDDRNKEWSKNFCERRGIDPKLIERAYTNIHPCHLDSICTMARKLN